MKKRKKERLERRKTERAAWHYGAFMNGERLAGFVILFDGYLSRKCMSHDLPYLTEVESALQVACCVDCDQFHFCGHELGIGDEFGLLVGREIIERCYFLMLVGAWCGGVDGKGRIRDNDGKTVWRLTW